MPTHTPKDSASSGDRRPTLRDVARASGFHATTISKALRGHSSIPEDTRKKIEDIAREMGYERNPVYYALSRFRKEGDVQAPTPKIAYLENFGLGSGIERPLHLQAMLEGARTQARLLGYELDPLAVGEDDHDSRSLTQYLRANQITGVVIGSFQPGFSELALNWDVYAVAKINSRHTQPKATVVGNDQLREVREAVRRLTTLGYKRIGLTIGRSDEDSCGHRHSAGYLMETAALSAENRIPPLLFPYNLHGSEVSAMIGRWVRRHQIDAVICNWTSIRDMLETAGLSTPGDVACATLCACDPEHESLAGMRPAFRLAGERAVSIVVSQLKSAEFGLPQFPSSIYVQSTWRDGASAPKRHV